MVECFVFLRPLGLRLNFGRKSLNELVDRLDQKGFLSAISYQPTVSAELDEDAEDAEAELA